MFLFALFSFTTRTVLSFGLLCYQLRHLFAVILNFNRPLEPKKLWLKHRGALAQDYFYKSKLIDHDYFGESDDVLYNRCLWEVDQILRSQGTNLTEFKGMPVASHSGLISKLF